MFERVEARSQPHKEQKNERGVRDSSLVLCRAVTSAKRGRGNPSRRHVPSLGASDENGYDRE